MAAWQAAYYQNDLQPILYLIQDYEPGFYPGPANISLPRAPTIRGPQIALFNTKLLKTFLTGRLLLYARILFEPGINQLLQYKKCDPPVKKQILIYGRPRRLQRLSPDRGILESLVQTAARCGGVEASLRG